MFSHRSFLPQVLAAALLIAAGCSSDPGGACVPGQSIACACPSGATSAQICQPDHTYAACPCGGAGPDMGAGIKRLFATSAAFTGNLGGLAGGDRRCQDAADAANLGGTFKAWLSTATVNAIDRFAEVGPYYTVDGKTKLFNNKAGLATLPLAPINRDEQGRLIEGVSGSAVRTGTLVGGTSSGHHCSGWSNGAADSDSTYGFAIDSDNQWTSFAAGNCSAEARLYCFEQ